MAKSCIVCHGSGLLLDDICPLCDGDVAGTDEDLENQAEAVDKFAVGEDLAKGSGKSKVVAVEMSKGR